MGRVAYLFPGQGSQDLGMGLAFAEAFPAAREIFHRADAALGFDLSRLVAEGPLATLALTEHTQPAVLTASVAALAAARAAGLPAPDFVAGHSLGEYSALVAANVLSVEHAVQIVRSRGRFMQEAVPVGQGAMAAVLGLASELVVVACAEAQADRPGECVVAANLNGPDQTVIAGHASAVAAATIRLEEKGAKRVVPLPVSAPFHSPLMAPAAPRLAEVLQNTVFSAPSVPVVTNVEASPERDPDRLRTLLVEQVTAPVRWTEVIARLGAEGCDTFLELGPGTVLGGLVKRQLKGSKVFSLFDPTRLEAARVALAS